MNEQQRFNYVNSTGKLPSKKRISPTHGVLYYKGKPITGEMHYALLQGLKKEYVKHGFVKKELKIKSYTK